MKRPWHVGLIFGLCLAVVLSAMGWISWQAMQLDRVEAMASRQAALEENVRLALWRMESSLAPLIAQESARPYFCYTSFYPAERAYTRMFAEIQPHEVRLPSPLLTSVSQHVLIHFQIEPDGRITSPQVPSGKVRELAEKGYTTRQRIELAEARLAVLQTRLDRRTIWAELPAIPASPAMPDLLPPEEPVQAQASTKNQTLRNSIEGIKRASAYQQAAVSNTFVHCAVCPDVREGMMEPLWVQNSLILARKVSVNGAEYVQGCELDWPVIRQVLIADVNDLLPQVDLLPVPRQSGEKPARMLAALPVQLMAGKVPVEADAELSPIRISLLMAWTCVLLAAAAVGVLLRGVVALSERRAAFVSAVTHELRTPLTTLRMYADMLAEQMVPDEQKRVHYLETMRAEADRLAHLVENVLSFSRLERNRAAGQLATLPLAELMRQVRPRLIQRAQQAGMSLVLSEGAPCGGVRANVGTVEQILFNLVDNACKYAGAAPDRSIHIQCDQTAEHVAIQVRDHGPGISRRDARRLFRPFSKSAQDAAQSASGVGLGLALSRRLARDMGGDLGLENHIEIGARFVLTLPRADV